MKLAVRFGCISDLLYISIYYDKTLRFREAASFIEMTKIKLAKPYLMYRRQLNIESFIEALCGQSLSIKMKQAVAMEIFFTIKSVISVN